MDATTKSHTSAADILGLIESARSGVKTTFDRLSTPLVTGCPVATEHLAGLHDTLHALAALDREVVNAEASPREHTPKPALPTSALSDVLGFIDDARKALELIASNGQPHDPGGDFFHDGITQLMVALYGARLRVDSLLPHEGREAGNG